MNQVLSPPGKAQHGHGDPSPVLAPTFAAKNGAVHYRGTWLPETTSRDMLRRFEAIARDPTDNFHTYAKELAAELREVLAEVYPEEIAA